MEVKEIPLKVRRVSLFAQSKIPAVISIAPGLCTYGNQPNVDRVDDGEIEDQQASMSR